MTLRYQLIFYLNRYDGTLEVAIFGDRGFKDYLSNRLPDIIQSSFLTDQEISREFEDIAKDVAKSTQGYFEVIIHVLSLNSKYRKI